MLNNGQINVMAMAANMYSDTRLTELVGQVSAFLTNFKRSVDRSWLEAPPQTFMRVR